MDPVNDIQGVASWIREVKASHRSQDKTLIPPALVSKALAWTSTKQKQYVLDTDSILRLHGMSKLATQRGDLSDENQQEVQQDIHLITQFITEQLIKRTTRSLFGGGGIPKDPTEQAEWRELHLATLFLNRTSTTPGRELIKNHDLRLRLAEISARNNPLKTAKNIQSFDLDPQGRAMIAKLCAKQGGARFAEISLFTANYVANFKITNQ